MNNSKRPLIVSIKADISELTQKEIDKILKDTTSIYGPIEMVVCCAAMSKPKMILQSEYKEYEHHMNLNFLGPLKIAQACAKMMAKNKTAGRIVLIGDPVASHYVIPSMSPYSCSKAALE